MCYGIIYILTSPSGKHYVGQTIRSLEDRWKQHTVPSNARCWAIHRAIQKYGPDLFQKDIIAECHDKSELDRLEKFWIQMLHSDDRRFGYNIRAGGSHGKLSEETRRKISEARTGVYAGENHPWFGRHHTEESKQKMREKVVSQETREKLSKSLLGKPGWNKGGHLSEETKRRISEATQGRIPWNIGVPMSEEARQHLSENFSGENHNWFGKQHSDETKDKMRASSTGENNPFFGKHHTEEARQKMSAARTGEGNPLFGKKHTEETKQKIREANKRYWAAKKAACSNQIT